MGNRRTPADEGERTAARIREERADTLTLEIGGKEVRLTHLNKVFFPESGYTKRDLLAYYSEMSRYVLPFLIDRPLVMRRYPNGISGKSFFQKEAPAPRPDWLATAAVDSKERGGKMLYAMANDLASLLFMTNLGCIDHNPWTNTASDATPDYLFFDLDPAEGTSFEVVLRVARAVSASLKLLHVSAFLKTSGATGFHVFVPLERGYSYDQARTFADAVVAMLREDPKIDALITTEREIARRPRGRVLMDTLQMARGKPLACAYSVRAFPGAPVSTPVSAAELAEGLAPGDWNLKTVPGRVKTRGELWANFFESRVRLEDVISRFARLAKSRGA